MVEGGSVAGLPVCQISIALFDDEVLLFRHRFNQCLNASWINWRIRQSQPFCRVFDEFLHGEKAVALFARLTEHIEQARLIAKIGVRSNAKLTGNGVSGNEPDAINIG